MSIPYSRVEDVVAVGGQATCFILPAPTRGVIARFIIKQMAGASDGFVYNIYDRWDACRSVSEQSFNPHDEALGDRIMHQIIAQQTVPAGQVQDLHFEAVWPYENKSERDVVSRRRLGEIYLEIVANAVGAEIPFQAAYTILQPELL